jgi:hypothetical protein
MVMVATSEVTNSDTLKIFILASEIISGGNFLTDMAIYRAFNQGGNRAWSVGPEQYFSRIAAVTADSRMSH